jgi:hypothetical protein
MLLFAALTLILTVATVWGGRIWLRNFERDRRIQGADPEKSGHLGRDAGDAVDKPQDELETILRGAVIGLRDGTISSDGLVRSSSAMNGCATRSACGAGA